MPVVHESSEKQRKREEKKAKKTKKEKKHACEDKVSKKDVSEKKKSKKRKSEDCSDAESSSRKSSKKIKHSDHKKVKVVDESVTAAETVPAEVGGEAPATVPKELQLNSYRISDSTKAILREKGITQLFPIQAATFDAIYDGKDVVGRARTGTGKTLSFALPITESLQKTQRKSRFPSVLVMCPTRELAKQVATEFERINSSLRILTVYGGVPYHSQERGMRDGIDVIVGTPGRITDHIDRKNLNLSNISYVVLDEADQMLDIGFADAMEKILQAIKVESQQSMQTLLFSATLPDWISQTIKKYLRADNMHKVDLVKDQKLKTNAGIKHMAIQCSWHQRKATIGDIIRVYGGGSKARVIIFTETKNEANELALGNHESMDGIDCQVLHGDIAQKQREITLQGFRDGKFRVLVATDVAARGLDIPDVDLVIQSTIPKDAETFVHRSGRTARANKTGTNIAFYKPMEDWMIKNLERKLGIRFERIGAPQVDDIIRSKVCEIVKQLDAVEPAVLSIFQKTAKDLLAGELALDSINVETTEEQAEELLARALAALTGMTKMPAPRSLLTCRENQTALAVRVPNPIRSSGYIRNILSRQFPDIDREEFTAFRMFKDSLGCVFDVQSSHVESMMKQWHSFNETTLEIVKELPELQDRDSGSAPGGGYQQQSFQRNGGRFGGQQSYQRGGNGNRNGNGGNGRTNGYSKSNWKN